MSDAPTRSVQRAAQLLRLIQESPGQFTAAGLARKLEMHRSTTWRLLHTMEAEGLIWVRIADKEDRRQGAHFFLTAFWDTGVMETICPPKPKNRFTKGQLERMGARLKMDAAAGLRVDEISVSALETLVEAAEWMASHE